MKNNAVLDRSRGSIVLRSGDDSEVGGNILLGTAGIRLYGASHRFLSVAPCRDGRSGSRGPACSRVLADPCIRVRRPCRERHW